MRDFISEFHAHSARQLAEFQKAESDRIKAIQDEKERKRKVGDATIELNEQTKRQNDILKAQLSETQKSNELLVKQAADSAKSNRRANIIAIASLLVAILSLIVALAK